jgi:hypothetical protein
MLTAKEAKKISDDYNNIHNLKFNHVLSLIEEQANKGNYDIQIRESYIDSFTKSKLIEIGYLVNNIPGYEIYSISWE